MVRLWFKKAAQDLMTAKLLHAQNSETFRGPLVFHAQQAVEKAVKGYLAFQKVRFPKTHEMGILIDLVAKADQNLSQSLQPTKILTVYAVAYRYPEETELPEPLTQKNCERILALAEDAYTLLTKECGVN